jgi:hypothetical protein
MISGDGEKPYGQGALRKFCYVLMARINNAHKVRRANPAVVIRAMCEG